MSLQVDNVTIIFEVPCVIPVAVRVGFLAAWRPLSGMSGLPWMCQCLPGVTTRISLPSLVCFCNAWLPEVMFYRGAVHSAAAKKAHVAMVAAECPNGCRRGRAHQKHP